MVHQRLGQVVQYHIAGVVLAERIEPDGVLDDLRVREEMMELVEDEVALVFGTGGHGREHGSRRVGG